jgi:hypothetical protein
MMKNMPECYDESVIDQGLMKTGTEVGILAKELFENPVTVEYSSDKTTMINSTKQLIEKGEKVICEASFATEGLFCSVDILVNVDGINVELYEVKSSTDVKDVHYHDVSYQVHVLRTCGYNVVRACVVHINNRYVRHGDIEPEKLFSIVDITGDVLSLQDEVAEQIRFLETYMENTAEPDRELSIDCFSPYKCGYWKYCTRELPSPNVFDIGGRMLKKKKFELYRKGIVSFRQAYSEGGLTSSAKIQVEAELENKIIVN